MANSFNQGGAFQAGQSMSPEVINLLQGILKGTGQAAMAGGQAAMMGAGSPVGQAMLGATSGTLGAMSEMNPGINFPKMAIDTFQKVGKKFYESKATEMFMNNPQQANELMMSVENQGAPQNATKNSPQMDQSKMAQSPTGGYAQGMNQLQSQGQIPAAQTEQDKALNLALARGGQPASSPFDPPTATSALQDVGKGIANAFGLDFSKGLFNNGGTDEKGNLVMPSALFGFIRNTPGDQVNLTNAALGQQEYGGNKPMQKGEREKMGLSAAYDIQREMAKVNNVDAMTPDNAAKFSLMSEGSNATKSISNMLSSDITGQMWSQGVPNFLKSQEGKLLESSIEAAVQARTRIETGAAMPPSDLKNTLKRYMPRKGDSLRTALTRLKPLNDYFEQSMNIADPTGTHRQRAVGSSRQQGNTPSRSSAPKGAKGWDTEKGAWVF